MSSQKFIFWPTVPNSKKWTQPTGITQLHRDLKCTGMSNGIWSYFHIFIHVQPGSNWDRPQRIANQTNITLIPEANDPTSHCGISDQNKKKTTAGTQLPFHNTHNSLKNPLECILRTFLLVSLHLQLLQLRHYHWNHQSFTNMQQHSRSRSNELYELSKHFVAVKLNI